MSHYKAKSIAIKKNSIAVTAASNNLIPLRFATFEFRGDKIDLLNDLVGGMIQPYHTAQNLKYFKAIEYLRENLDKATGIDNADFYDIMKTKRMIERGTFEEEEARLIEAIQNNPNSKEYWEEKLQQLNEYKTLLQGEKRDQFDAFISQAVEIMEAKPRKQKVYLKAQGEYILKRGRNYYLSAVKPVKPFTLDQAEMTKKKLAHLEIETVTA